MRIFKIITVILFGFIFNSATSQNSDQVQQKINQYIGLAQLDSAKTYIQSNLKDTTQKKQLNALTYQLVKVFFMQSAYNDALKQAFNSLDSINDEDQRVKFNFMIGCIYSAILDYDKSIEYFDLVIKHNAENSLNLQTHILLSQLHLELKDTINARQSITEAYKITSISKEDSQLNRHVAMQYNFFNENYELCKQQNLETVRDSTSALYSKSYAYSMIGECLTKQDSLNEATKYFEEFLKLTFETKDPDQIKVAATKLIDLHEKLGNQDEANGYHKIYNEAIGDSLSFSVEKYRDLYTIEKNRELKSAKNKNSRTYLIYGSFLLLLISAGVYYFFKRERKKREALIPEEKIPGKKIVVSDSEIEKITTAIDELKTKQLFLKPNITRKSFCADSDIKSVRYLSYYINENHKKSFSVFINDLRIEYAFNRIQNDSKFRNYKIEEIAKDCGFGSKKSFERAFLAKYNESPFKFISRITTSSDYLY
jgi:AraC-like DNA-binding protein